MNEILPFLFLGGLKDAENPAALEAAGVRAVVTCCTYQECPKYTEKEGLDYFRVDVEDTSREPLHLYFQEAGQFIDRYVSRQQTVLVHCKAGVSRSASVVLSYLIGCKKFALQEAFFHVLTKRPCICPNIGFMEQLCAYEREVRDSCSVCMFKYTDWYTADSSYRPAIPDLEP
ncbi:Dusp7 protein, related [Neospora caninum Liverpool]|uniref:protein-tyrosine-phosphatase n=1 Tax=Neospora caninum (strain Liverpool) TaxID=572307 RepID=F0VMF8_NEOCL|nr:Dusp7 protein, related [Neospora caninum Liverpool]CBZ54904.1 Dusp7 protein, related [Neospora caninum Liverpool]CEL69625.1 TPA: Dusp7 protein, related [Neospora caninum Liverpool]|eukprot:XP_003884932.1 Dusp7 protein, related [Neospora caninum Liverpool]